MGGPGLIWSNSKYAGYKQLKSKSIVPPTRLSTVGDRAFSVAAARAWNSLPSTALSAPSLEIFRQRLKTELFSRSFMSPNIQTIRKHSA